VYDPRIGKFLSVDPLTKKYPELTPYQYASNRPVDSIDLDGLEWIKPIPTFAYEHKWYDYVSAADNAAISLINLVPTLWNSGVATVQSVKKGTYGEDLRSESREMVSGLKQSAVKALNDPIITLTSPQALEFALSAYLSGKFLPLGGNGNLLRSITIKTEAELPAGTQVMGSSASKVLARKTLAQNYFTAAGKSPQDVGRLMQTINFSSAVREIVSLWRFERINSKIESVGGSIFLQTHMVLTQVLSR
jgi:hypothetical protein